MPHFSARPRPARLAAVWLLLLSLSPLAPAADWTYTVRPGDTLWDFSTQYLKGTEYWPRVQALNKVKNPQHLQPGSRLTVPVAWLKHQPTPAKVISLQGEVRLKAATGSTAALKSGAEIFSGDELICGPDGSITLEFADGSRLLIEPNSTVVMDTLGSFEQTGMVDTSVRLLRGRVENRVIPQSGKRRYQIITPAAVAAVRGTRFRVAAEAERPVMLSEVLEGAVGVSGAGASQDVGAGFGTRAEAGKAPLPPRRLLAAPNLGGLARHLKPQALDFSWPAEAAASAYHAQLSGDASFSTLLHDTLLDAARFQWPALPAGEYFLRVRARDDIGLEGLDAVHRFTVSEPLSAPGLQTPRDGARSSGVAVWLAWTQVPGARGYYLQIAADPAFTQNLNEISGVIAAHYQLGSDLAPGIYHWRVAAMDAKGIVGEFSAPRRFEVGE